ncbi:glycosyltransferase [Lentilactobacillus hilgardii]|nr:glycosyltransferase [Lentilactobacillus hilgardii]MCV3743082.1 glycosyltransferase [Lentilactobacillus hilgardii]
MGKKILEVFGEPISYGGQESFVFGALDSMDLSGLHFDFLTPYYIDNEYYRKFIRKLGGRLYLFNLKFIPGKSRINIISKFNHFLSNHEYDVIHIHSGSISVLAFCSLIAKLHKTKKIIVHSHMAGSKESVKHKILRKIMHPIFITCVTYFCAPTKAAGKWQFSKKIANNKLILVKNGINLNLFSFDYIKRNIMRKKLNISKNTLLVGNVGRLNLYKNQIFLIKIIAELKRAEPDSKLLLIGSGENYKRKLEFLSEKYGVSDSVIFTGNVNNVYDYMQAMDIFVFPSKFEGLGIVAIESQGVGLPVIASNHVPREIKVTRNVYFMKLTDHPCEWANKILNIRGYSRCDTSKEIKEHGYDIHQTAEIIRDLYL